jgi:hypothetical protein
MKDQSLRSHDYVFVKIQSVLRHVSVLQYRLQVGGIPQIAQKLPVHRVGLRFQVR